MALAAFIVTRREPIAAMPLLVLSDPFDVTRYAGHTTLTTFKVVFCAVALALAERRALRVPRGRTARLVLLTLGAVVVATALTVPFAAYRQPALRETLKALEYAAVFFVAVCVVRRSPAAPALLAWSAGVAVIVVTAAALGDFTHPRSGLWIAGHAYLRVAGPLEGPNQLAAWLGIVLPVSATLEGIAPLTALTVGSLLLALTLSRSGSAQTLAAVVAVNGRNWRATAVAVGAFVLMLAGFAIISRSTGTAAHFLSTADSLDRGGTGSRAILWQAAVAMFRAHPLLGVGAGNFEFLLPAYGAPPQVRTQANSLYLESLADGGVILGLATAVAAWLPPVLLFACRDRRTPFVFAAAVAGAFLALHGADDDVTFYTKVGQCWWLVAGTAAGVLEPPEG